MKLEKKIQQAVAYNFKRITLSAEEYESLTEDYKRLLEMNNIDVNIE